MMEYRIRTKRSDEWIEKYKGSQVTPDMIELKVEGKCRILKPNGKPLLVYLPGAAKEISDEVYPNFADIRMPTENRGYAAGSERKPRVEGSKRARAVPVLSGILGSFEATGPAQYCRLTAFTAQKVNEWEKLLPYFRVIAELFEAHVPERFAAQMVAVENTSPDWVIDGTPFTTITVNNTYPTGLHTDKGDLDEGFSTLGVMRRGHYVGGWLSFPQYGVAADMQDGDVILMDAHEWHGNTPLLCGYCATSLDRPDHRCERIPQDIDSPERVSVVSYFRTNMVECGSLQEEQERRLALKEKRNAERLGLAEEVAEEAAGINPEEGA